MAYDTDEISQRGTRETKRKRKPTWKSRLLKGAFWVAWGWGNSLTSSNGCPGCPATNRATLNVRIWRKEDREC